MRFSRGAALLVPLLAQARSIPLDNQLNRPTEVSEFDITGSSASFDLPRQADDESFHITFQVQEPFEDAACGHSNLVVNGQPLPQDWTFDSWDWSGQGISTISVPSSLSSHNVSLELFTRSVCQTGALVGSSTAADPVIDGESGVLEFTHVTVQSIDGRPSDTKLGFTIVFHQPTLRIVDAVLASDPTRAQVARLLEPLSRGPLVESDDTAQSIDKASTDLDYLEHELAILTSIVDKQRDLVSDLSRSNRPALKEALKQCENAACVGKTLFQHLKDCLRMFTAHLKAAKEEKVPGTYQESGCFWSQSRVARMKALQEGTELCPPKNGAFKSPEKSNISTTSVTSADQSLKASLNQSAGSPEDTYHNILVPISFVACILCLGCFSIKLHRRCCNPRARAERAARREECRTRRQYRKLARRQAWKKWWNERVLRNREPSSTDYEEKRSLILAQEAILERAAQDDIRRLCGDQSAAEEGRAMSQCDTLPEYRSRAGSGSRPPSYRGDLESGSTTVDGGSRSYTPVGSDVTPDSSVAAISPRHSSETLRSQFSML